MKFTNHQVYGADLLGEESTLRLFIAKLLSIKDKDKNLKDNPREMSDY